MALLEVNNLSKTFGGVAAIADLHFTLPAGMIYSIIGPNGAGKTTLFNMLSGIYQPDEGEIQFQDHSLVAKKSHRIAALGITRTFQNLQIFYNMSVLENVKVGAHLRGQCSFLSSIFRLPQVRQEEQKITAWAHEALDFCELTHLAGQSAGKLPYGELKRLEVARALASKPKLIMMDEPAAGLNDTETKQMQELLFQIRDAGITVLLVEHNMALVMQVSERILVLDYGSRLAEGTTAEIRKNQAVIEAYLGGEVHYAVE